MAAGLEFYSETGELIYSSNRFKIIREAQILEPSSIQIILGSGTSTEVKLTYTFPAGRGFAFLGYYGGVVRLKPTPFTLNLSFRDSYATQPTEAMVRARGKLNANIVMF